MNRQFHIICFLLLIAYCRPAVGQPAGSLEEALAGIVANLSQQMKESQTNKVAVVPFPDLNGFQSALGEFLAEELITQLFVQNPGRFAVVERRQLNKVLEEQQLSTSAVFEADNISKLGKILGVDAIVTGSIADLGAEIKINARAIAISTASVFAAAAAKAPKQGTAESLMMQNAPLPQSSTTVAISPVQHADAYFSNSSLRVGIAQIAQSDDLHQIMLALSLENLTNSDLLLALEYEDGRCIARMIDNLGNQYRPKHASRELSGINCLYRRHMDSPGEFTTLSAKGKTTIVIPLFGDTETTGSLFSFASTFAIFQEKTPTRFSVGISNIQATP